MKLTEENKKRIDDYFSKLTNKELIHINEKYFDKLKKAINYTRCSEKLKDKESISFDQWMKNNNVGNDPFGYVYKNRFYIYYELHSIYKQYIKDNNL